MADDFVRVNELPVKAGAITATSRFLNAENPTEVFVAQQIADYVAASEAFGGTLTSLKNAAVASAAEASEHAADTEAAVAEAVGAKNEAIDAADTAAAHTASLAGTSATSHAIAIGSKVFATQSGKNFGVGTPLLIRSAASPLTRRMYGVVTAYSGETLTFTVESITGSGTYTDWLINIAGLAITGPPGAGTPGVDGRTILSSTGVPDNGSGVNGDFCIDLTNRRLYGPKAAGAWSTFIILGGVDGTNANAILSGIGAPLPETGADNDFYLDKDVLILYGPKTAGAWGLGISIKGTDGTNGKTLLNAAADPLVGAGVLGDFHLNTATLTLFGPKTGGGWGSGVSLRGTDGKAVLNGIIAPVIEIGVDGDFYVNTETLQLYGPKTSGGWGDAVNLRGTDGNTIRSGTAAPSSGDGADGDYWFDKTAKRFYGPKTAGAWDGGVHVEGTDGVDGDKGWSPVFAMASDSARRVLLVQDWVGGEGTKPTTGLYVGIAGLTATIGDAIDIRGPIGADGRTIYGGDGAPSSGLGVSGDIYLDTFATRLYWKTGAGWGAGVSLIGGGGDGSGDMTREVYDTDNDGIVDAAETVPWTGVVGRPDLHEVATSGDYLELENKPDLGVYVLKAGGTLTGPLEEKATVSLASAATTNVGAAASTNISLTGTADISSLGASDAGVRRTMFCVSAPRFMHGTAIVMPGAANFQAAASDFLEFVSLGSGNWRCVRILRASGKPIVMPTKADLGLGNVDNTSDLGKPISTLTQSALDNKQAINTLLTSMAAAGLAANKMLYGSGTNVASQTDLTAWARTFLAIVDAPAARTLLGVEAIANKNAANGYVGLDSGGKIDEAYLPSVALTDTFEVANQTAMLALTAERGDVAVRSDLNKSFILKQTPATTLANWIELRTPTDVVLAVAGLTGSITKEALKGALDIVVADIDDASANGRSLISAANYGAMKGLLAITTADITDATANGRSLISAANYAAMKTLLAITVSDITNASANGRSLISAANYAAMKTLLAMALADVTDATANGRSLVSAANYAAMKVLLGLENVDNTSDSTKWTTSATLTNKTINGPSNTITNLALSNFASGVIDTDASMAADSDTRVPTQKATRGYISTVLANMDYARMAGPINASTNPNYPAANSGDVYRITTAGRIGGASGPVVEVNDSVTCVVDGSVAGNHATVGANWFIAQANIDGAVTGPASATSGNAASFNGTSGKVVQDSGKALPGGTIVGTTDTQTLTNKTLTSPAISNPTGLDKDDVGLGNVDNTTDANKPVSIATQDALDAKENIGELAGINTQTGTSYTLALADKGKVVEMNNAAANILTIPPNSTVAFPINARIDIFQLGAGQTSIAAGAGVTIRSDAGKLKIAAQYGGASLYKRGTNEWVLGGGLAS